MNNLLKWWLLSCLTAVFCYIAYYLGFFTELYENDVTKLSFLIIGLYIVVSCFTGYWIYRKANGVNVSTQTNVGWFISESMLALGMIGTVAGFILMLGGSFSDIDTSNPDTLKAALKSMALGMSTALYTTLVGLVCSQLYKIQLVILESMRNER